MVLCLFFLNDCSWTSADSDDVGNFQNRCSWLKNTVQTWLTASSQTNSIGIHTFHCCNIYRLDCDKNTHKFKFSPCVFFLTIAPLFLLYGIARSVCYLDDLSSDSNHVMFRGNKWCSSWPTCKPCFSFMLCNWRCLYPHFHILSFLLLLCMGLLWNLGHAIIYCIWVSFFGCFFHL